MTNVSELLNSFTKEDYINNRINLHIHSTYSDGKASFHEIENFANEKYKYYAITDHNTIQGHIDNPNSKAIVGVEFDVWYKYIFLHLLAYGVDINNSKLKPFYAKSKKETEADIVRIFARRNLRDLISAIHDAGGIAVLAHPACCWAVSLEDFVKDLVAMGLDGIEVYYPYPRWRKYIKFSNPNQIEKLADKYNLIKTGGTDCHSSVV
ncbi:PHP domain-containing protein [bacterium]|nr:PHP domain-containing protein [bacterium]